MAKSKAAVVIEAAGHEVSISNPDKVLIPEASVTKLDLAHYYLAVADGALLGSGGRPNVLVRYPNGIHDEFFYQKRAPEKRPDWVDVCTLRFPSGRTAEEVVPNHAATLLWMANLGCLELHPHPVRVEDLDHPDELRVDLDPMPGVQFTQLRDVARVVHEVLSDFALVGWPKTSGSRGIHINVRIERRWSFPEVRRAALALAREVERRAPALATSKWWKEERHGVFLDYNQNAKDRTVAGAYSVRPKPDARVSAPVTWEELERCEPEEFTLRTMPARFRDVGDPHVGMNDAVGSIEKLLELSARHEGEGLGDAPWPPHYQKQEGEPRRVMPSRAKKEKKEQSGAQEESKSADRSDGGPSPSPLPGAEGKEKRGRRVPKHPLIEVARAKQKEEALSKLEAWKSAHPDVVPYLGETDVLVDSMRGRFATWTRVRINLRNVPENMRPAQEELPESAAELSGFTGFDPRQKPSRARKPS